MKKKPYVKPSVVHTEKIEARAVVCAKVDDTACTGGPLAS